MKIIAGLGNPGTKYENTRHNAGFMAVDELADRLGLVFSQEKFSSQFAKGKINGEDVVLLKPQTYMNDSGIALRQCLDYYKASPQDVVILYDDLDLPVGKIRIRQKGSAGGHNGVKSVIHCIFTNEFDRIRIGIGKNPQIPMIGWVLGKFPSEQKQDLQTALDAAAKAAEDIILNGTMHAMNSYNAKKV